MISLLKKLFTYSEVTAFTEEETLADGLGFYHKGQKFIHHSNLHPKETAFYRFAAKQKIVLAFMLLFLVLALLVNWHATLVVLTAILTILYFGDLLFNL